METKNAMAIEIGDVLNQVIGPALALKTKIVQGGMECYVCPPGGGAKRYLWFWPKSSIGVIRADPARAAQIIKAGKDAVKRFKTPGA